MLSTILFTPQFTVQFTVQREYNGCAITKAVSFTYDLASKPLRSHYHDLLECLSFDRDKPLPELNTADITEPPLSTAGLFRRLFALVYDSFLIFGITLTYAAIVLGLRIWITGLEADQLPEYSGLPRILFIVGLWFFPALFYCLCWRRSGQTLGMKTWRLKLLALDNQAPTWSQCWARCVLAPLSLVAVGIGYLWCLTGDRHCLHDLWTGTHVVVLPKPSK